MTTISKQLKFILEILKMGLRNGKPLKQREVDDLVRTTHCLLLSFSLFFSARLTLSFKVTAEEVDQLFVSYERISNSIKRDGVIDMEEFQSALGVQHGPLVARRLFEVFDRNSDHVLTFEEFVTGLSAFSARATPQEKLIASFKLYDLDGDGSISREELAELLRATISESIVLPEEELQMIVDATFAEADADHDGRIGFADYAQMAERNPGLLRRLTLSFASTTPRDSPPPAAVAAAVHEQVR